MDKIEWGPQVRDHFESLGYKILFKPEIITKSYNMYYKLLNYCKISGKVRINTFIQEGHIKLVKSEKIFTSKLQKN